MTIPPPHDPYGPVLDSAATAQQRGGTGRASLVMAIATVAVAITITLGSQLYVRLAPDFNPSIFGLFSTLGAVITTIVAIVAVIVGVAGLRNDVSNRASAGAAVGIGAFVILEHLIFLPLSFLQF